ncbi:winged helix-turn-helix domain-containing protein [Micromonospora sp. NPDC047548]|uniref:winged helix-turn-helix domain-containing protein n=1 Tax=Micromonospora sp. NPDC047548 TaxID=3155624 RepID=UPI0033CE1772
MPARWLTYEQIAADLAERIASGEYAPGTKLPSNKALAELYSVSTATIERAHIVLRERRLTYGVIGRGVFVAEREEGDS